MSFKASGAAIAGLLLTVWVQLACGQQQGGQQAGGSADQHHAMVMQHGEMAMGFSQTETTHHFILKKEGGVIQVETKDPKDAKNRDLIRMHLAHITQAFAGGDFSDPMTVHGRIPPGVPVMQKLKADIHYRFEQAPQGGRVLIQTTNPRALDAIHEFLRFQIQDHQTGDSLKVY
jgi:hypothetical protein